MARRFPYKPLWSYPHFSKEETLIWERFIRTYPDYFVEVEYDVPVGTPRKYEGEYPFGIKEMMEEKSKKRIDVVGYSKPELGKVFVIEVENNAMLSAIGEVAGKARLFASEHPEYPKVYPMLITNRENPDVRRLCGEFGVIFYVV
ncbi:MAG: hypothetical protein QW841_04745 [Candidatus Aenigmatarchaeota archaeon]